MKLTRNPAFTPVAQEHPMGCAVACVASRCGMEYALALRLFGEDRHAWTRGYYCKEVVKALAEAGLPYDFAVFRASQHATTLETPGTIVFVGPSHQYPAGHYVLRTELGWMNPWVNFPHMAPVRAAVSEELPGAPAYVIFARSGASGG